MFGIIALAAGLVWARRTSLDWLANQPQYQIPFDQIQLVDDAGRPAQPPRWYRGGSQAFLENVRIDSQEPDAVPVLQVAADRLSQAFKNYAWVREVTRVAYEPGTIRVELRYRQPVAWVQLRGTEQIMVDDKGTILPAKDIDVSALGRVIMIFGDTHDGGLAPPADRRFGVKWKTREQGSELEKVDERILAAARLASFLVRRRASPRRREVRLIAYDLDQRDPLQSRRPLYHECRRCRDILGRRPWIRTPGFPKRRREMGPPPPVG